jgi:hypothetical protein
MGKTTVLINYLNPVRSSAKYENTTFNLDDVEGKSIVVDRRGNKVTRTKTEPPDENAITAEKED